MRLSELLDEVAVALDAKSTTNPGKWPLGDRVKSLNTQQRSIVRKLVELDEAYHNHTFTLSSTAARSVHQGIVSWRVPPWVVKISSVRISYGGSSTTRGSMLPRATKYREFGWRHTAANEIQLVGHGSPVNLELEVAKLPARMTSGVLPAQPGPTNQLQLEAAPTYGIESQVDSYAGGLFEVTSGAALGQTLRATSSTAAGLLTMEEAWGVAPASGNTWEMHAEMPTQHTRLLVLLAVRALLAQERNLEGIAVFRDELNEQWRLFIESIQYRDLAEPHTVIECIPTLGYEPETSYLDEYR